MSNTQPTGFKSVIWEYTKVIVSALALAFVIRSFWFEPYKIPSGSMVPTLLVGDFLFVNKYTYGLHIPFTDKIYYEDEPKRGDILVFKREGSGLEGSFFGLGNTYFIKRVVGLPGDELAYYGKTLYINGKEVKTKPTGSYTYTTGSGKEVKARKYDANMEGIKHNILIMGSRPYEDLAPMIVPPRKYVMMGDNRDNSLDSRAWKYPDWGYISREDITGRAEFIFWSWTNNFVPRLERIGNTLRRQMVGE